MKPLDIPYYDDFLSPGLRQYLESQQRPVAGVPGLTEIGPRDAFETVEGLAFVCGLYDGVKDELRKVLNQRQSDRRFIDQRTRACHALNQSLKTDFHSPDYATVIGHEDAHGRIVCGPKNADFCLPSQQKAVAPIPGFLAGPHVTLFGPPDNAKLAINAMNAWHRKLPGEPEIVAELLAMGGVVPKWGADDEDSKTPLRADLIAARHHLAQCYTGDLELTDERSGKEYKLERDHLSIPIKRFPGLALPSTFLFYRGSPLPLHLYDFALHLFENWQHDHALAFYVPKLENEEEARYIRIMVETAEELLHARHPAYRKGSVRLLVVLENPRAIFRANEIMDELYPYFAGASLGWHDYLASTARLFKEDPNYRIPVKADPDIVIKYIKASHELLANVIGARGGIKIGGMYGVLPKDNDIQSQSFQLTMKGFIKDVITQFKRGLSGFWVAHPDFVRLGIALVEAWRLHENHDSTKLDLLVTSLLPMEAHQDILAFIHGPDLAGLDTSDPLYPRALLVAEAKASTFIANNHPEEIRYNVFQSLQYLADWLSGNGCVALPAIINGVPVRIMDDLATAERSRWEVWHEIRHGRFSMDEFLKIVAEEMRFIRKDLSNDQKIVQVKWSTATEKWYGIAERIMIQLMTREEPVEFATELLQPFTIESIRQSADPWAALMAVAAEKYRLPPYVERFHHYFSACGSLSFATAMARDAFFSTQRAQDFILGFTEDDIAQAASFHGDIGEQARTLDKKASKEQSLVTKEAEDLRATLRALGVKYRDRFGFKYLISAQGKSGADIFADLTARLKNTHEQELKNARLALWEITRKRLKSSTDVTDRIAAALGKHAVTGASFSIATPQGHLQTLCFGERFKGGADVTTETWFELASLSKTVASCFAIEFFSAANIPLSTPVNRVLATTSSAFRIKSADPAHADWAEHVTLRHLMNHQALNIHYVNGVPVGRKMPAVSELITGHALFGYPEVAVISEPGSVFRYSGGGFLVLEHVMECLTGQRIQDFTKSFLADLGLNDLSFRQETLNDVSYAHGYLSDGKEVEGGRKMFPAFAAGAMGTARGMGRFLEALTAAFHDPKGFGPISHNTAVQMLGGRDRSSQAFMGVNNGLGVFIAEAEGNRFAIHQGANDGFRCLYLHCFAGPDRGYGIVALCNADSNGVPFIAESAQIILTEWRLRGVNVGLFKESYDETSVPLEQRVNLGYKELIFGAFAEDLPDAIDRHGPHDPLAQYNLLVGATMEDVTDQRFARAENLLSPFPPTFDPGLYGRQGKIMDSWETVRHNPRPADELTVRLKSPSPIRFASFSTKYHLGNQAPAVSIDGQTLDGKWDVVVAKTALAGHSLKKIMTVSGAKIFTRVRIAIWPDGGLSRVALFGDDLPKGERDAFLPEGQAQNSVFADPIPHARRPLVPSFEVTPDTVRRNWAALGKGDDVDVACAAFGGRVVHASNEHFGPAAQIISPYPPLHMFDGFESARSRETGHSEHVLIALGKASAVHRIDIDFTYFRNNNPRELQLEGLSEGRWLPLVERTDVKAYAGNVISFAVQRPEIFTEIRVTVFPDGGLHRVRVISRT